MALYFSQRVKGVDKGFSLFHELRTLQVNLGNLCNQNCFHCHVDAHPREEKIMSREVMEEIIRFLSRNQKLILDITGGCPELNPGFCFFVKRARGLTSKMMVRSNLTVIFEKGMEWLPAFYRENRLCLVCSLPCYSEGNVDRQRGSGTFQKSIEALRILNRLGYGSDKELELDLVYNPGGAFLPPLQEKLEKDYKERLKEDFGIVFLNLFTITNAPISRFRRYLEANGQLKKYQELLERSFNPETVENMMCRTILSVDWQGIVYLEEMKKREIIFDHHCYCCTAGSGSSCTGTLA
jgi:radical SAM/Cys-rich protein